MFVHVRPPDEIGNKARQNRHLVSIHQQSNVDASSQSRRNALCYKISNNTRVSPWPRNSISMMFLQTVSALTLLMSHHWNPQQLEEELHVCLAEGLSSVIFKLVL
ncbi:hypothetical protein TNCV_2304791 [Trichonephila clavipes]|nr:hypothetical protein TNCV_2304791 [Trichonephila clavipes]